MAKIDECTVASEVTKKINILQAIRWIAEAWEKVTVDTIKKCFRSSGILDSKFELRSLDILNGDDPFEDCDVDGNDTELADLVSRVQVENNCSVEELIHNEDDTPVCGEVTDDTWDEAFFSELGPVAKHLNSKDDDIDSFELCSEADDMYSEEADVVEVEHPTTVNSYFDAIKALEDVCWYLEQKGHTDEATIVSSFDNVHIHSHGQMHHQQYGIDSPPHG